MKFPAVSISIAVFAAHAFRSSKRNLTENADETDETDSSIAMPLDTVTQRQAVLPGCFKVFVGPHNGSWHSKHAYIDIHGVLPEDIADAVCDARPVNTDDWGGVFRVTRDLGNTTLEGMGRPLIRVERIDSGQKHWGQQLEIHCCRRSLACAPGYVLSIGDSEGWGVVNGKGGGQVVSSCQACGDMCSADGSCGSYECSDSTRECSLNEAQNPSTRPLQDYAFCTNTTVCNPEVANIHGSWVSMGSIVGNRTITQRWGTISTGRTETSFNWAARVRAGFTSVIPWYGLHRVSADFRASWESSYNHELETSVSNQTEFTISLSDQMSDLPLHAWKFEFSAANGCGDLSSKTTTQEWAFSSYLGEQPCCYPGHCRDNSIDGCRWCTPGFKLPSMVDNEACKEGTPPCEVGAIFPILSGDTHSFVQLTEEFASGQQIRMPCPSPFNETSEVHLQCLIGRLYLSGHSCNVVSCG